MLPSFQFAEAADDGSERRVGVIEIGIGIDNKLPRNVAFDLAIGVREMVELILLHAKEITRDRVVTGVIKFLRLGLRAAVYCLDIASYPSTSNPRSSPPAPQKRLSSMQRLLEFDPDL